MFKRGIMWVLVIAAVCAAFVAYNHYINKKPYNENEIACGNGRLEATEVIISTKLSGRIEKIFVDEGSSVKIGDKLVQMQTNTLEAQLAQAKATKLQAEASLMREKAKYEGAKSRFERKQNLRKSETISVQEMETAQTEFKANEADIEVEKAKLAAAVADIQRIQADIDDSLLMAKHTGRIQYRIAQEGEVLSAGGGVLNLANLTDVYMNFYLPEKRLDLPVGGEARIVLDVARDHPIPATITYVSDEAQFTPKSVETQTEREKLMFRVKAKIDPRLLEKYIEYVKTGLPGVAYVKIKKDAAWPEFLQLKPEMKAALEEIKGGSPAGAAVPAATPAVPVAPAAK